MNGPQNSSHFDDNRMTLLNSQPFLRRPATIWSIFLLMNDSSGGDDKGDDHDNLDNDDDDDTDEAFEAKIEMGQVME